ncbi:RraA family protein [Flavimaricola marinus]|uniref:Putative 4-hydroxy-4-methyl-2-oxoglutarate aldolase n=1 Tax=Flavimaricola marinus TaxID=1819565 RepID=A0A238LJ57_9RHOB|nr:4-hydroxy-4-methyl-2-oxoglutarate aldolase [Flavimaricola marinus]SMY09444.1 4-hydroxy-4-methyl-2-oxoglutarate aldolase [Flavimaricola marinus]
MIAKYAIGASAPQVSATLLKRLEEVELATIGHFADRGFMHPSIKPLTPPKGTITGTAVTVAIPGMDSTLLQYAVSTLREGDILVVDRLGDARHACIGGGVASAIARKGGAAAIIGGPCTDPDEIMELGLPVYSTGVSSITTRIRDGGGALNKPVSVGGVPVLPGDIVMADATGVIVIPPDEAEAICEVALARQKKTAEMFARFAAGEQPAGPSPAIQFVENALRGENNG